MTSGSLPGRSGVVAGGAEGRNANASDVAILDSTQAAEWLDWQQREGLLAGLQARLEELAAPITDPTQVIGVMVVGVTQHHWPVEVAGFWVAVARRRGCTWQEIAEELGVSRQAAHRRYGPWEQRYNARWHEHEQKAATPTASTGIQEEEP